MSDPRDTRPRLSGSPLILARASWLVLAGSIVGLFIARAIELYFRNAFRNDFGTRVP